MLARYESEQRLHGVTILRGGCDVPKQYPKGLMTVWQWSDIWCYLKLAAG
jgi:hypothetical protein